jgi:ribosome biogenesis GTPase
MTGTVFKSTGSWYTVRDEAGKDWACRIKGKLRLLNERVTNPVAVGDYVDFEPEKGESGQGVISGVHMRRNYVLRSSPRKRFQVHLLACNVDQVMLVTSIAQPMVKPGFIDRFLLTTETRDIPVYLIFNKKDLYSEEDLLLCRGLRRIYEAIGYQTFLVSAATGEGLEAVRQQLEGRTTLMSGHSGVGKSSLVNALQPGLELRTQELSDHSGKGLHTTTFAEMHPFGASGLLIDTPGIKELGFINLEPLDVAHNYRELFAASPGCKFNNCLHVNEPDCAVKAAVESGQISELRYQSYLSVLEEVQAQKHWERKTDW